MGKSLEPPKPVEQRIESHLTNANAGQNAYDYEFDPRFAESGKSMVLGQMNGPPPPGQEGAPVRQPSLKASGIHDQSVLVVDQTNWKRCGKPKGKIFKIIEGQLC